MQIGARIQIIIELFDIFHDTSLPFDIILAKFFKNNNIWSYSFGLVAGKIETWRPSFDLASPEMEGIWYHDIFKPDHTPYEPTEVEYIRSVLKD